MSKKRILILVFGLVLVSSFLIDSCKKTDPVMGGDPNEIKITGLEGKTGRVTVTVYSDATTPIISGEDMIKDGAVQIAFKHRNGQPWTDKGRYLVRVALGNDEFYYTNGKSRDQIGLKETESSEQRFKKIPKYKFSRGVSTIQFNKFVNRDDLF